MKKKSEYIVFWGGHIPTYLIQDLSLTSSSVSLIPTYHTLHPLTPGSKVVLLSYGTYLT